MSNKAVFLDRDNTLIEDPGYINHPDQVKLLEGVAEALIELKAMGYKLIVVSNQSAVARGIVTEKVLAQIHDRLKQLLAERGAYLDRIYYCPYHPDGIVPKYRKESDWRKPNPGMLLTAADQMDIELGQSWMIGNSNRDIEAGLRAGCKTILINRFSDYKQLRPSDPKPDHRAVNIKEATNIIKKYYRSPSDVCPSSEVELLQRTDAQSRYGLGLRRDETQPAPVEQTEPVIQIEEQSYPPEPIELQIKPSEPQMSPPVQQISGDRTEQLLNSILEQLKSIQRADMFGEFSIMRFIAGIVQIVVLFCLLITIGFLMSPDRQDNAVFIALGFAMVLQLMSLTFYIMQGRK